MIHKNELSSIIRTILLTFMYLSFRASLRLCRIKYVYQVILVIVDSLPANTGARQAEGLYPPALAPALHSPLARVNTDFLSKHLIFQKIRVEPV